MALEDIFRALEAQAEEECEEILAAARDQAASIASEAKEQAEEIKRARVEVAERDVRIKVAQRLNAARLDARKRTAAVKDNAISAAFDGAVGRLGELRGGKAYAESFKVLAAEALAGVDGEVEVLVAPADAELAKKTLASLGADASIREELDTSGGLVVVSGAGTVFRSNTLEDRLARLRGCCQSDVARILLA